MLHLFRDQPPAFNMIFMLEVWERFGFYTIQGILVLYFIRFLGFSDSEAYFCFGAFSALVYGMIAIGGYLGDHVLGTKRTILLGLVTLTLGYFSLAMTDKAHVFWALGLICVGNGLFKANPANLLSKCYDEKDPRLHSGFTLYYMAINLGALFALFVGPYLSHRYGYAYAYGASSLGLVLGLVNYVMNRQTIRHINQPADKKRVPIWQWGAIAVGIVLVTWMSSYLLQHVELAKRLLSVIIIIIVGVYGAYWWREKGASAWRMGVALVLMMEAIIFFVLYQQMPTSLNLFAVNNVYHTFWGIDLDPQSFQALNPIWIILVSPLLAIGYNKLSQRGIEIAIPYKFAAGMLSCGLSFALLFFARFWHDDQGMVSAGWLVASYFFQSTGELLVSALGVAMVAELVPLDITGFVMGMWFLTSSIAGFIGATVATYTALPASIHPGVESLFIYTRVFAYIGIVTLVLGLIMWLFAPRLKHLSRAR